MSVMYRAVVAVVVVVCVSLSAAVGSAFAGPLWRVDSLSNTTVAPGGAFTYKVQLTNIGDAPADGTVDPIVFSAALPAGVLATGVSVAIQPGQALACTNVFPASTLQCSDNSETVPDEMESGEFHRITVSVAAEAQSGAPASGVASFHVSGGGAPAAGAVDPTVFTSALPQFGVDAFDAQVSDAAGGPFTQAAGHPFEVSSSFDIDTMHNPSPLIGELWPVQPLKDAFVDLPPGLSGDPAGLARCTVGQLANSAGTGPKPLCPVGSQVGTVLLRLGTPQAPPSAYGPLPVFNMVATPNAPARFGFNVLGTIVLLDASVRSGSDYGVTILGRDVSEAIPTVGTTFTFWGVPADPAHDSERACPGYFAPPFGGPSCPSSAPRSAFLRYPTACTAPGQGLPWALHVDSWSEPGVFKEAAFRSHGLPGYPAAPGEWGAPVGVSGCEGVPFTPSLSVLPTSSQPDSPAGADVALSIPQETLSEPNALAQSDLKKTVVVLPHGLSINPAAASGLAACSASQIDLRSAASPSCPDASKLGTAEVHTPLLEDALQGSVYLAAQNENPFGSLLAIYLVAEGHGVVIKVAGHIEADAITGQLTTTLDDLPQQPFDSVKLDLFGGPHGALATPAACGASQVESTLEGWSGKTVSRSTPYSVDCTPGLGGFSPSFAAGTVTPQAGAFSPFTLTFSRQDGEQQLAALTVKMPPGLLGILKSVTQCPEPQAAQGACGEGSLIGHVAAAAGAGPDPVWVQGGRAYLTGPYKGAPFGLSVAIPAKAGPFDLGTVVVRSRIDVDPHTSQITITSDPFPTILQGIPLQIRTVNVTVDRPGFLFNPTNCEPLAVGGTITSTQGAGATLSSHFQAVNCATLPFKPTFKVTTKARTSKKNGASLDVKITSGTGQANLGKVAVTLPKQLPSWLPTIQQACLAAVFDANPAACPAGSDIGVASATTPILANPVTGPVYLVSHGGAAFPDIVMVLQGEGVTVEQTGSINIKGQVTSSAFNSIPDVPIGTFELNLPQGPHHALSSNLPAKAKGSFCGQSLVMPTTLTGQNGAQIKQSTKIAVTGCPKAKKAKKHSRKKGK